MDVKMNTLKKKGKKQIQLEADLDRERTAKNWTAVQNTLQKYIKQEGYDEAIENMTNAELALEGKDPKKAKKYLQKALELQLENEV
jgi:hypothetical protein